MKVAFIGMTLKGTPTIVTPTGVAGLEFRDEADTVNALIPRAARSAASTPSSCSCTRAASRPSACRRTLQRSDINGCDGDLKNADGSDSEIRRSSRARRRVDLVISGHTHAAYNCSANTVDVNERRQPVAAQATPRPTGLPNNEGRLVPVTSSSCVRPRADRHRPDDRRPRQHDATSSPCARTTASSTAPTRRSTTRSPPTPACRTRRRLQHRWSRRSRMP